MTITSIIFDYDGTLIDSIPAHKRAIRKVAKKHGIIITEEAFARYNGMSTKEGFGSIMREHHITFGAIRIAWEMRKEKKSIHEHINIYPDTKRTLERLEKRYALAIATSSNKAYLRKTLERFPIKEHFKAFTTANDVRHTKPSPAIFLKAASKLSAEPEACVVIEDSMNGVIAAKRAGMSVIAILTTTDKALFVGEAAPDAFITSLDELTETTIKQAAANAAIRRQTTREEL